MSNSEFEAFHAKLFQEENVQSLLAAANDEETFVALAADVARAAGLSISPAQIRSMIKDAVPARELSEQQLDAVAGGYTSFGSSLLCGLCGGQSGTCNLSQASFRAK